MNVRAAPERDLAKESAAAKSLREALAAMTDDADAIRDTIEGETGLHEAIAAVLNSMREDEILVIGVTGMIETLEARKHRLKERVERCRAAVEQAMSIGEIRTLQLPDATVSVRAVPPGVEIEDEAKIPSQFWKARDPALDRAAVKAALKEGQIVPGARLGNGSISLSVRRS